eukprot:9477329-Pyramimonas_sp.AAC.1
MRWRLRDASSEIDQLKTLKHEVYTWGYGDGPLTNSHEGREIMVSSQRFGQRAFVDIKSPPKQIQGYAGALRYQRGECDLAFIAAYFSPRSGLAAKSNQLVTTVIETHKWINSTLLATPTCSTPTIGIDSRDHQYGADGLIADEVHEAFGDSQLHGRP